MAMGDPYGRYFLANGIILYDLTYDDIGLGYKDGIDNDGDGNIDEGIDKGIDEPDEKWFDGIDNDGDGDIDLSDYNSLTANFNLIGGYGAASTAVPEPAALLLALFGLALLPRRRRR